MSADNNKPAGGQARLELELVPMRVAAAMAYFDISGTRTVADSEAQLAEIGRLAAIALSTVAPIYMVAEGAEHPTVLSFEEVNRRLFQAKVPDLNVLAIRRDDLQSAIKALKEARTNLR